VGGDRGGRGAAARRIRERLDRPNYYVLLKAPLGEAPGAARIPAPSWALRLESEKVKVRKTAEKERVSETEVSSARGTESLPMGIDGVETKVAVDTTWVHPALQLGIGGPLKFILRFFFRHKKTPI
jgi:hypothetical protein